MGALYDEEDELDFSFLKQSVRQQPGGAARRRTAESGRDQMANLVSGRRQVQVSRGREVQRKNQKRAVQVGSRRPATMQGKQAALLARKKRRLHRQKQLLAAMLCVLLIGTALAILQLQKEVSEPMQETGGQTVVQVQAEGTGKDFVWGTIQGIPESQYNQHPEWTEDFLTISEYSRPGDPLEEVKNIFVHYTANPNTSAAQNRSYFENLKDNHDVRGASAHFIIGINGEILQIVPLDEIAYAVQTRNGDSISIECCFKNQNGQFTQDTYDSLIALLAWLVSTYRLEPDDILRHYDCGGKKCPLYYVDHEDAWRILKQDVADRIAGLQ